VQMVEAKVAPEVIVSQLRASKTNFTLSATEVIRLTRAGVPATVIEAMRNPQAAPPSDKPVGFASNAASGAAPGTAPDVAPLSAPITLPVVLGDALPVRLTLAEDISTDAMEGDVVRFKVAHEVRVEDTVVIRRGAGAVGVIMDGARKRIFGIGGRVTFRLDSVDAVDGQKVMLRATETLRRDGLSKRPVGAIGRKSRDVAAAAGTEYVGFVDGSNTVMVKK
jgi:hypothetical protein